MAIFIPTTCPICAADTHSIAPQRKDGTPKGRIITKCLACGFEKEIFIDVPEIKESTDGGNQN